MILKEDSLLQFSYDISTQILSISWPDLSATPLPDIENSLEKLARNIRNFDIRKVMADHRFGFTSRDEEAYKKVIENYHLNLAQSHLEKLARIIPDNPAREYFINQLSRELDQKLGLPFKVKCFSTKTEAQNWLLES